MFEELGLDEENFAVYQALLRRPDLIRTAHRDELASAAGISEIAVDKHLDALRELGLLVPRWNIPDEEYPIHPRPGFEMLAARRQAEIDTLVGALNADRTAAGRFVADYTDFIVQKNAGGVEVLEGERAYQRMQHFSPMKRMWAMFPPDGVPERDPEESGDKALLSRGLDARYMDRRVSGKVPWNSRIRRVRPAVWRPIPSGTVSPTEDDHLR